jgi:hypothetical protein
VTFEIKLTVLQLTSNSINMCYVTQYVEQSSFKDAIVTQLLMKLFCLLQATTRPHPEPDE